MTFLAKQGLERDDMSLGKIRRGRTFLAEKRKGKDKTYFKRANIALGGSPSWSLHSFFLT